MNALSAASIALIEAAPVDAVGSWRRDRVQVFDLPEGKVIVKGHRPMRSPWRYWLLNGVARLLGSPYVRAVPMHGGLLSQTTEIKRLTALQGVGVPVPKVLLVKPDYFVMNYLGADCLGGLINQGHADAFALWKQTCALVLLAHQKGQYLSQCFGRNVIVDGGVRGFIDFEDDPCEVMTLEQAQVRDWLIFLNSTVAMLQIPRTQLDAAIAHALSLETRAIQDALRKAAASMGWFRFLPASAKPLGRDVYRLQAVADALHRWSLKSLSV